MNTADWIQATGHPIVGRGGRPINPKLVPHLMTKTRSAKSTLSARQARKLIVQAARLAGEVDDLLSPTAPRRRARAATHSPTITEQSWAGPIGAAARMRHNAVVQRWRKGF